MAFTALRYMTRFQCIAERCEDACCHQFKFPLTGSDFRQIKRALNEPEDAHPLPVWALPSDSADTAAYLKPKEDGRCIFWDDDKLCSLQKRFGESVLADACAEFPRIVNRIHEDTELSGSMMCPEAARLALLAPDGMDVVPGTESLLPRPLAPPSSVVGSSEPYSAQLAPIRAAALRVHANGRPVAEQLAFLGHLAAEVTLFYYPGTPEPAESLDTKLKAKLAMADDAAVQAQIAREVASLEINGGIPASYLVGTLQGRLTVRHIDRLGLFARGVLAEVGEDLAPEALWARYTERRARLDAAFGERVQMYLRHYCLYRWYRTPCTRSPTLLAYVFDLTARIAQLRFSLVFHPRVRALLERLDGRPGVAGSPEEAELDAAVVEAAQLLSKYVEGGTKFGLILKNNTAGTVEDGLTRQVIYTSLC